MSKDIKFGASLNRLEDIVNKLENDNLDLDESMKLLEEGLSIHKNLESKLKKSKDKIDKIVTSGEVN